ncbi:hypothetical protein ACE6JH_00020 [Streptomyces nigra]
MILKTLAADAEEHRSERDRLAILAEQLADERDAITDAEAELDEDAEHAKPLAEQASAAAKTSNQIRTCATTVRTALTTAPHGGPPRRWHCERTRRRSGPAHIRP